MNEINMFESKNLQTRKKTIQKFEELPQLKEMTDEDYMKILSDTTLCNDLSKRTTLNKMKSAVAHVGVSSFHELLNSPHVYGPNILKITDLHKRKNMFVGILAFLNYSDIKRGDHKPVYNAWYRYFKIADKELQVFIESNQQSKRQKETYVSWEDVLDKRESLVYGSNDHLVLSMYSMIPPRRQLDYMNMRIYTKATINPEMDHNHLHMYSDKHDGPYMFVKHYKDAKHFKYPYFGDNIPIELIDILLENLKQHPRMYLFTKNGFTTNEPYEDSSNSQKFINRTLKRIFDGKAVTVGTLRHSFASYVNSKKGLTLGQRKRIAWEMGHSLIQNLEYVKNVSEDSIEDEYKIEVL